MPSFADYQSAWSTPAAPPPPPPGDDQQAGKPILTVTPAAPAAAKGPTSFSDIQNAWADKSPAPAGFKDDNAPTLAASVKDAATQLPAGIAESGALAAGMPGDLQSMGNSFWDKASNRAIHYLAKKYQEDIQGKPWSADDERDFQAYANLTAPGPDNVVQKMADKVGVPALGVSSIPTSEQTSQAFQAMTGALPDPQTPAGRYARTVGNFVPYAIGPEGLLAGGVRGAVSGAGRIGADVVAPAVGSQAATDATDDPALKPLAGMLGGMGAGAATHGAMKSAAVAGDAAMRSPLTVGAASKVPFVGDRLAGSLAERAAAGKIANAATDLPTFAQKLDVNQAPTDASGMIQTPGAAPSPSPDRPIPGFVPTTAELAPDAGIAQLQRGDRIAYAGDYQQRLAEQRQAQADAAKTLTPPGDPTAVSDLVQRHLDAIDSAADEHVRTASKAARQRTDAIGTGQSPDEIGADLRSHLEAAAEASKDHYRQLYSLVNPDGTLATDTSGVLAKADKVYGQMSPTAQAFMAPAERTFVGILDQYKPNMPFNEVVELKSELAEALRAARATPGQGRAVARMSSLMGPIQDAISGSVKERAATDAGAVSQGTMAPEAAMEARVRQWAQEHYARRQQTGLAVDSGGIVGLPGTRPVAFVGGDRATSQGRERPRGAPSDPGVPPQASRLPTAEDAANLRAADAAFRQHQQTFNEGSMKPVLAPGSRAGEFKAADYSVPRQVLRAGPAGHRAAIAYLDATGNTPEAMQSLKNALAETLRDKINAEGFLPSDKLVSWKNRYQHTIRAIEDRSPGFARDFDGAASASDAALRAARDKARQIKAYQDSALGKYLGSQDAEGVIERIGRTLSSGPDRVSNTRALVNGAGKDPAALAGLRNAVGEWLSRQYLGDLKTMEGDPTVAEHVFRRKFRQLAPSLKEVLTPEQLETAGRIADTFDMQRRSTTGSRLEGTSGTTQDAAEAKKQGHGGGHSGSLLGAIAAGSVAGGELLPHGTHGALAGGALAAGAYMARTLRAAGLHSIQEATHEALMHPDVARHLLKRFSPNELREQRLAGSLKSAFIRREDDDNGAPSTNEPPPTGPFSPGSRERAIAVHGPSDIDPARARVNVDATPAQAEAGNYRKGHVVIDGMPVSIENPKGSIRYGQGRDGKPWSVEMPADYGYFKGSKGADGEHIDTYIGERPSNGVAHIVDQVDPDTKRFDEHKVILNAGDADQARAIYHGGFSDGRGAERLGGVTPIATDKLREWLSAPQPKRPFASSRFAKQNPVRVEPTWHPDADATHQAILGHEARLKAMASQLKPDASVRDIAAKTKQASDDLLAMGRAVSGQLGFDFGAAAGERNPLISGGGSKSEPAAPAAPRTPFQSHMHALADTLDRIGNDSTFGEVPAGAHKTAYERQRALAGAVKDLGKGIDRVFAEIHRVAGDSDIAYDNDVSESLKSGMHDDIRERATDMRADMRDPGMVGESATERHVDIREMASAIAREVREVADTNAWIEREKGDEGIFHPDDLDHLADQVEGMAARFDDLFDRIDTSSRAQYHTGDSGARELVEHVSNHIKDAQSLADDLRQSAADMREADEEPRASVRSAVQAAQAPAGAGRPDLSVRNPTTGTSVQAQHVTSLGGALERFDVSRDAGADQMQAASHLAIGDRIARLAGNTPVYVVGPAEMRALAERRLKLAAGMEPAGFYDPRAGHIVALDDAVKDPQAASRLMLHEGTHAALMRVINESESARNIVDHLRQTAAAMHFERGGQDGEHYGLTNAHEFMSEAMSNPEFQRFLGSLPADDRLVRAFGLQSTGRTIWDAFVGAMRRVLGLRPDQHTYLDAAMKLGGHLMDYADEKAGLPSTPWASSVPPRPAVPPNLRLPPYGAMPGQSEFMARMGPLFGGP